MSKIKDFSSLLERTIHKYTQIEKKQMFTVGDIKLSHIEIHTIESIGDNDGINLTRLAKEKGITKSAASQMIYRLREKGLVEKKVSPENEAQIVLSLTEKGRQAYTLHREYHKKADNYFLKILNTISTETIDEMTVALKKIDEAFTPLIND